MQCAYKDSVTSHLPCKVLHLETAQFNEFSWPNIQSFSYIWSTTVFVYQDEVFLKTWVKLKVSGLTVIAFQLF